MSKKQWTALIVGLGLFGLTALTLRQMGASHRLGKPGLKLAAEPTRVEGGQVIRTESVGLPAFISGYESRPMEITTVEANWLPKDTLFGRRLYQANDGFWVEVTAVLMGTDRTSIHKPQFCLDGQGWHIQKTETVSVPMARPHPYELQVMKLTAAKSVTDTKGNPVKLTGIYVYWFVADNLLTPFHGERMWWMARELIQTGVLERWAYVSYWTSCPPGLEEVAFGRIKELIAESVPEFQLASGPARVVRETAMGPGANPGASLEGKN